MEPGRFPASRPRRLRRSPALRALVAEARLTPEQLVAPGVAADEEVVAVEVVVGDGRRDWSKTHGES
jgi:porphobilinogen synthase